MYVYTHFQSGSFIRTKSSASSSGGQPASLLRTERDKCLETNVEGCDVTLLLQTRSIWFSVQRDGRSLCGAEGQLEVLPGLVGVQDGVLEGVREEAVHQGAEGNAVLPAGGEVLDVHLLLPTKKEGWGLVLKEDYGEEGHTRCPTGQ